MHTLQKLHIVKSVYRDSWIRWKNVFLACVAYMTIFQIFLWYFCYIIRCHRLEGSWNAWSPEAGRQAGWLYTLNDKKMQSILIQRWVYKCFSVFKKCPQSPCWQMQGKARISISIFSLHLAFVPHLPSFQHMQPESIFQAQPVGNEAYSLFI